MWKWQKKKRIFPHEKKFLWIRGLGRRIFINSQTVRFLSKAMTFHWFLNQCSLATFNFSDKKFEKFENLKFSREFFQKIVFFSQESIPCEAKKQSTTRYSHFPISLTHICRIYDLKNDTALWKRSLSDTNLEEKRNEVEKTHKRAGELTRGSGNSQEGRGTHKRAGEFTREPGTYKRAGPKSENWQRYKWSRKRPKSDGSCTAWRNTPPPLYCWYWPQGRCNYSKNRPSTCPPESCPTPDTGHEFSAMQSPWPVRRCAARRRWCSAPRPQSRWWNCRWPARERTWLRADQRKKKWRKGRMPPSCVCLPHSGLACLGKQAQNKAGNHQHLLPFITHFCLHQQVLFARPSNEAKLIMTLRNNSSSCAGILLWMWMKKWLFWNNGEKHCFKRHEVWYIVDRVIFLCREPGDIRPRSTSPWVYTV